MKKLLLIIVLAVSVTNVFGATYYWVGGNGTWGTTASFATTSGGTGAALYPTNTDDIIFDSNSGTNPVVTVYAATVKSFSFQSCNVSFALGSAFTQATNGLTSGSSSVTLSGSNPNIAAGQTITVSSGTGTLQASTAVTTVSGTSLTLSKTASATGTATLQFSNLFLLTATDVTLTNSTITTASNFVINNSLTFSGSSTFVVTTATNGQGITLGNGNAFTLTGNSSSNYFDTGNGNGYINFNTSSALTAYFNSNSAYAWGALNNPKGIITLGNNVNTSRITFGSNGNNYTQGFVLNPNVSLTISGNGSCTFNSTTNCQGIDASASGSKVIITSQNASILTTTSGNKIFKPATTINYLEFNKSGSTFTLPQAIIATNLVLTNGTISNTTNNITLSNGGTVTRVAGTLSSTLTSYGTTPNVVYSNTTATITGNELPSSVASITIAGSNTVTLNAPLTITGTLNLTSNTLTNSATNNITFDGGLNPVEIFRTAGQIGGASSTYPIFTTNVNVTYNGSSAINTGYEWPLTASKLTNLTVNNSAGVTMAASRTVNGILQLTSGTLTTGANTLTLKGTTAGSGTIETSTTGTLVYGGSNAQTISNLTSSAVNSLTIDNAAGVAVDGNITAGTLTLNGSKVLNVAAGKQLTVSTTMTNNGTLNLLATSDNRIAATIITPATISGTGTTNVNQYLGTTRNWYVSSPITGAVAPSGFSYYQRDVTGASWLSQPFVAGNTFQKGKGYIALPGTAGATLTFTGSGLNHLNTGDVDVNLSAAGFNLIGNPYPSHLTWTPAFVDDFTNAAKIDPTIWIRTNAGSVNSGGDADWSFLTFNGHSGEAVPLTSIITGGVIPPMQAFWVKSLITGTLTLDNKLTRSHQASNALKAPAVKNTDRKRLRLQVTSGTAIDETLLYFDANAQDNFDNYDSQKMFVNSTTLPEIYTTASAEKLVINGMNDVKYNTEIPLGFVSGQTNSFSIKATELKNFEAGTRIILRDKVDVVDYELNGDNAYTFTSDAVNSTSRFSLLFKSPSIPTDIADAKNSNAYAFVNSNNYIVISASEKSNYAIYNAVGQLIDNGFINSKLHTLNCKLTQGVYVVNVNNQTTKVIIK